MTRTGIPQKVKSPVALTANWQERAQCKTLSPELFSEPEFARWGVEACQGCSVKPQCAATRRGAEGVWAGKAYYSPRRK